MKMPVVHPRLADERADEGGPAADEARAARGTPRSAFALGRDRRDDAEALGRVVEPEPDDEQQRQADLAGRGGLPDGEALGEVVEADPERDEERESLGPRSAERPVRAVISLIDAGARATRTAAGGEPSVVVHEARPARRR